MIQRIQGWLDRRPKTRLFAATTGEVLLYLFRMCVAAVTWGGFGAMSVVTFIVLVNIASPVSSIDAVAGTWTMTMITLGIVAAFGGALLYVLKSNRRNIEYRSRAQRAHDLMLEGIVAYGIGYPSLDLRLNLLSEGGMGHWGRPYDQENGADLVEQGAFDLLTIRMANPSLNDDSYNALRLRRVWLRDIANLAAEVETLRAAKGIFSNHTSVINEAAERARFILGQVDASTKDRIESELRASGHIRPERFLELIFSANSTMDTVIT